MITSKKPAGFTPRFVAVSVIVEHKSLILFLRRRIEKPQGGKWGLPTGKVDTKDGESDRQALRRELLEETGIAIKAVEPEFLKEFYVELPDIGAYTYPLFLYRSPVQPRVTINPNEHTDYTWMPFNRALQANDLVEHTADCLKACTRQLRKRFLLW